MAEKINMYTATGRRKESVARVRLVQGDGKIEVNKRPFENYFPKDTHRLFIKQPLKAVKLDAKFNVFAAVDGGGISGQAGAMRHGIARALVKVDANLRQSLKKSGFLTRDPRAKERKKYGRKRARKRFQYTKR